MREVEVHKAGTCSKKPERLKTDVWRTDMDSLVMVFKLLLS